MTVHAYEGEIEAALREVTSWDGRWRPFSKDENVWHTCPGHEWERFEWSGGTGAELVTRCRNCGAPRCDSYDAESFKSLGHGRWENVPDAQQQFYRCTEERHHSAPHDFLTGKSVEVGG